jgi:hypothetical protein
VVAVQAQGQTTQARELSTLAPSNAAGGFPALRSRTRPHAFTHERAAAEPGQTYEPEVPVEAYILADGNAGGPTDHWGNCLDSAED